MDTKDTLLTFDDEIIVDSFMLDDKIIAVIDLEEMNIEDGGCYAFAELTNEEGSLFIKSLDDEVYSRAVDEYKFIVELLS